MSLGMLRKPAAACRVGRRCSSWTILVNTAVEGAAFPYAKYASIPIVCSIQIMNKTSQYAHWMSGLSMDDTRQYAYGMHMVN
jgi:hypothetical protein